MVNIVHPSHKQSAFTVAIAMALAAAIIVIALVNPKLAHAAEVDDLLWKAKLQFDVEFLNAEAGVLVPWYARFCSPKEGLPLRGSYRLRAENHRNEVEGLIRALRDSTFAKYLTEGTRANFIRLLKEPAPPCPK